MPGRSPLHDIASSNWEREGTIIALPRKRVTGQCRTREAAVRVLRRRGRGVRVAPQASGSSMQPTPSGDRCSPWRYEPASASANCERCVGRPRPDPGRLVVRRCDWRGHVGTPKSGRNRELPLSGDALAALKAQRHLPKLVFRMDTGRAFKENECKWPIWRACRRAGPAQEQPGTCCATPSPRNW